MFIPDSWVCKDWYRDNLTLPVTSMGHILTNIWVITLSFWIILAKRQPCHSNTFKTVPQISYYESKVFFTSIFIYVYVMITSEYLIFASQAVWVLKSKVSGQESTIVKWNDQILCLHPVTVRQKMGRHFSNKVVLKLKSAKNAFYKKGVLKFTFFNEKKIQKDSDDFWHRKFTLKVQNRHFLTNCQRMETQNLVISFDYSWF